MDLNDLNSLGLMGGMDVKTVEKIIKASAQKRINDLTANLGQKDFENYDMSADACATKTTEEYPNINPNVARMDHAQFKNVVESGPTILCEKCDNHTFSAVFVVKRLSAHVSPTGEEMIAPIQTYQCAKCGHCNQLFLPHHAIADVINFTNPNIELTEEEKERIRLAREPLLKKETRASKTKARAKKRAKSKKATKTKTK